MKPNLKLTLLTAGLCLLASGLHGGPVFFPIQQMTGLTNDTVVNVRAVNNPTIYNGRFYWLPAAGTNLTTSGGYVTNTFVPGAYTVTIGSLAQSWTMYVTNNTTEVSAADLSRGVTIYASGSGSGTAGALTNNDSRDITLAGSLFTGQGFSPGTRLFFTNENYPGLELQPVTSAERDLMTETTLPGAAIYNTESNRVQVATGSSTWKTLAFTTDTSNPSTNIYGVPFTSLRPVYNVRDFGANGNDGSIAGDQAGIQAAIDAASTNAGGGVVYFPVGTYWLTNVPAKPGFKSENHESLLVILSNNITLLGEWKYATTIKLCPNTGALTNMNGIGSGDRNAMTYNGATNTVFENLTFDGNYPAQDYCYDFTQFYNSENTTIRNCRFINTREDAIDIEGRHLVENCDFIGVGNSCMTVVEDGSIYRNLNITNCGIADADGDDTIACTVGTGTFENINYHGGSGRIFLKSGNATFKNSTFYFTNALGANFTNEVNTKLRLVNCNISRPYAASTNGYVIGFTSGQILVDGCSFLNAKVFGLTNAAQFVFVNNDVFAQVADWGIIDGSAKPVQINNNTVTGGSATGIRFVDNTRRSDNAVISGNVFNNADLYIEKMSTNDIIAFNTFDNASSLRLFGSGTGSHRVIGNSFKKSDCNLDLDCEFTLFSGNHVWTVLQGGGMYWNKFIGNTFKVAFTGSYSRTNWNMFANNYWHGSGLPFVGGSVSTITTSTTLSEFEEDTIWNGTSLTCTLPSAVTMGYGKKFRVLNVNSTSLTIATTSSQTINGTTPTAQAQWVTRCYLSNGANWVILSN